MTLLFGYAAAVLCLLFAQISSGGVWVSEVWSGSPAHAPATYEAPLLLGFSLILPLVAYSYIAFKRPSTRLTPFLVSFACAAALLSV